jgi:hypothetical protein
VPSTAAFVAAADRSCLAELQEDISMRAVLVVLTLLVSSLVAAANEQFGGSCAFGLSELGVDVKTDCSIRWADPKTGKLYCFGNEEVLAKFLKDPNANVRKAEETYARLYAK